MKMCREERQISENGFCKHEEEKEDEEADEGREEVEEEEEGGCRCLMYNK